MFSFIRKLPLIILSLYAARPAGFAAAPSVLSRETAEKLANKQLSQGFQFSGLAFFDKKLYASCNLGILEFTNASLTTLYQWSKFDSVVEGPWLDNANGLLWVWLPGRDQIASYDGRKWKTMRMPEPRNGFSRGNILEGFRGICSSRTFWLEGGWHAWAWDPKRSAWPEERIPPTPGLPHFTHVRRLIPTDNGLLFVMFRDLELMYPDAELQQKQIGDVIFYFAGKWNEVTNKSHFVFFSEQTVYLGKRSYIRTTRGDVLEVSTNGIQRLQCPGKCEALARTSSSTLAASFRNLGVYELRKDWGLRFEAPYSSPPGEHWAHLAESAGQIALAVAPVPELVGDKIVYNSTAALWLFDGQRLQKIAFPKEPEKR